MTNRETIARELLIAKFHSPVVADEILSGLDLTETMRHEMIVAFAAADRLIASGYVGVNADRDIELALNDLDEKLVERSLDISWNRKSEKAVKFLSDNHAWEFVTAARAALAKAKEQSQ